MLGIGKGFDTKPQDDAFSSASGPPLGLTRACSAPGGPRLCVKISCPVPPVLRSACFSTLGAVAPDPRPSPRREGAKTMRKNRRDFPSWRLRVLAILASRGGFG